MDVIESNFEDYKKLVMPKTFYNDPEFINLNSTKADKVHYLIFKDTKNRFALSIGERNGLWLCPFSAPFGTFVNIKSKWDIYQLEESINAFDDFMYKKRQKYVLNCHPSSILPK